MGGNVFLGKNRRYSKAEYIALEEYLSDGKFSVLFKKFHVCEAVQDKESFGDMDVLCIPFIPLSVEHLKDFFNTDYVKNNGGTWSLIFEEFQIDLITTNKEEFDFHKNYLARGDRGNFIGKIAHQLGLKFGHDGLWLPVRAGDDHKLGDILLTLDPVRAEAFLDIKPLVNPQTFQDVFDNIIASKYFNPELFALENNNCISRVRDKKRPYYHQFLELCKTLPKKEYFSRSEDKNQYLPLIFEAFPNAFKEYRILWARKEKRDRVAEMFNGDIASKITGLTGKELGEFMKRIRVELTDDLIIRMTQHQVNMWVSDFFKAIEK